MGRFIRDVAILATIPALAMLPLHTASVYGTWTVFIIVPFYLIGMYFLERNKV